MASSGPKKMLFLIILYTPKSVSENVCPVISYWTLSFNFDNLWPNLANIKVIKADVIASIMW